MGPPMSPNVGGGLMAHPRPQHPQHTQHPPRGPPGPSLAPRGTQAALKAEQDLKVLYYDLVSIDLAWLIKWCFSDGLFGWIRFFSVPLQAKQRAEVLQSTHKFFSEQQQQQQIKSPMVSKVSLVDQGGKPSLDMSAPNHQAGGDRPDSDKPPISSSKPIRTGPIKPQAIKPEEGK